MPCRTQSPVLTLDGFKMRNIDPQDPAGLFGIWSIFQKASGMTEDGIRAENMTWRLWNQEMLLASRRQRQRKNTSSSTYSLPAAREIRREDSSASKMPSLSRSVDSLSSHDDANTEDEVLSPTDEAFDSQDSCVAIQPVDDRNIPMQLEHLVSSIKDRQELKALSPLPRPYQMPQDDAPEMGAEEQRLKRQTSPLVTSDSRLESTPTPTATTLPRPVHVDSSTETVLTAIDSYTSPAANSDTSVDTNVSSHSVVRGFKPGEGTSTYRSQSQLAPLSSPLSQPAAVPKPILPRRKNRMFMLGASSGDDESSFRDHMSPRSAATPGQGDTSRSSASSKKQTSFDEHVTEIKSTMMARPDYGSAIESSDEEEDESDSDEDVSESAIEEDDEDAWEDEGESTEDISKRELTFPRIDSKPQLVSRRSLLTDKVAEGQRAQAMQEAAMTEANLSRRRSRTSNPNGPSLPPSPSNEESPLTQAAAAEGSRSAQSKPISMSYSQIHPPCPPGPPTLSPRSTRRNMLTTELGVSLRKNMLLERQHRSVFTNPAIQRRHTSGDVKNLSNYPNGVSGSQQPQQQQAQQQQQQQQQQQPLQAEYVNGQSAQYGGAPSKAQWNEYFSPGLGEYHQKGW